jgi:hypothetical protein
MVQVVEHLPIKPKALSSNSSTASAPRNLELMNLMDHLEIKDAIHRKLSRGK